MNVRIAPNPALPPYDHADSSEISKSNTPPAPWHPAFVTTSESRLRDATDFSVASLLTQKFFSSRCRASCRHLGKPAVIITMSERRSRIIVAPVTKHQLFTGPPAEDPDSSLRRPLCDIHQHNIAQFFLSRPECAIRAHVSAPTTVILFAFNLLSFICLQSDTLMPSCSR